MTERYITPSKITAWLDCAHFLALKHQVEDGLREAPAGGMSSFAQLLADKGIQHEAACLGEYEREGKHVFRVPDRHKGESFTAWVSRVGNPLEADWDVIPDAVRTRREPRDRRLPGPCGRRRGGRDVRARKREVGPQGGQAGSRP